MARKPKAKKKVEALTHDEESRRNIPTAELESVMADGDKDPIRVAYQRRNRDLDPQLVWRGKDEQDEADLVVQAPPLYIQEKVHPKVLIDDLSRESRERAEEEEPDTPDLFADFNGLPNLEARTEFYQHDQNWSNRMILGDSLQVMASLAERERLRGKVQCVYMDPPYGIKFNSNFQWSTTSRDVRDGRTEHITREPEQVKAYRDTWRDGIHSYLAYLRDRLTAARELLAKSGTIFVQIGDENVHRVRSVVDEVFGADSFVAIITVKKTAGLGKGAMAEVVDFILWYAKDRESVKRHLLFLEKEPETDTAYSLVKETVGKFRRVSDGERVDRDDYARFQMLLAAGRTPSCVYRVSFLGMEFDPTAGRSWSTNSEGIARLISADRVVLAGKTINYVRFVGDNPTNPISNLWSDTASGSGMDKTYVVQTSTKVIERCILMATDPGDLVLDPTCGSGTTAYVAEQWGRRWITIDTSRVALTLARARIMGARYRYYLLADSREGQLKESEIARKAASTASTYGDIRHGFIYERVPHVTLKAIANNAEIGVIHERMQPVVDDALGELNEALGWHETPFVVTTGGRRGCEIRFDAEEHQADTLPNGQEVPAYEMLEWEVPREAPDDWPAVTAEPLTRFWKARVTRQREIDASIAAHADFEVLYDKPYEDRNKVRVAGPLTVESLTPHRIVVAEPSAVGARPGDQVREAHGDYAINEHSPAPTAYEFTAVILDQLRSAGVQQVEKRSKIDFTLLTGWPGRFICAEGRYYEGKKERRAGIMIGPEYGTVGRADLIAAAREAGDAGFDVLIGCAFNYDAQSTNTNTLGRLPILKARMNADLHMSTNLKETKGGNLFVIFGEPDIDVLSAPEDRIQVKINGVDLFDPRTGEVRSSEAGDLACWFIDTNYDMESFFVRHAYFLGANDPYKALKTTLKAEIDEQAWQSLHSDTSRPFKKPSSGRIAVKAINHLGDEVMKVVDVT